MRAINSKAVIMADKSGAIAKQLNDYTTVIGCEAFWPETNHAEVLIWLELRRPMNHRYFCGASEASDHVAQFLGYYSFKFKGIQAKPVDQAFAAWRKSHPWPRLAAKFMSPDPIEIFFLH